jgi:RsiW-degrading membrane proteinase PrsW (M82 family)
MLLGLIVGLCLITPLVLAYLVVIKTADRYEPEPWWLIGLMFLWGAFGATALALVGNIAGLAAFTLALGAQSPILDGATASIVAPIVEETTKGFGLLLLFLVSLAWLRELDGPLDGAIYGGVVGLGFTLTEDLLYVAHRIGSDGVGSGLVLLFLRTVLAGLGHASYTAMTGLGFGIAVISRSALPRILAPLAGWTVAVGLHSLHNLLVSFFGVGGFLIKLVGFWFFDALFFLLLFLLAMRDRRILIAGLRDEVGRLLHGFELGNTASLKMLLPFWNLYSLSQGGGGRYAQRRAKQLALVELAFIKDRRRHGERGLGQREATLRTKIAAASQQGIFVGVNR